VSEQ